MIGVLLALLDTRGNTLDLAQNLKENSGPLQSQERWRNFILHRSGG